MSEEGRVLNEQSERYIKCMIDYMNLINEKRVRLKRVEETKERDEVAKMIIAGTKSEIEWEQEVMNKMRKGIIMMEYHAEMIEEEKKNIDTCSRLV